MGWWSASILGGDEPLDYLGDLADICGVGNPDYDMDKTNLKPAERNRLDTLYSYDFTATIVNNPKTRKKMENYCTKAYTPAIAYQVLGVILMATGANIPKALKNKIIKAAQNDEWAESKDQERISFIQSYIACLNTYTAGTPVYTTVEGLFQKMNEAFNEGKKGLINKNI